MNVVKNYYKSMDLCIITPYDGQRAVIVGALKAENLPWDCVYNVDSFQGKPSPLSLMCYIAERTRYRTFVQIQGMKRRTL